MENEKIKTRTNRIYMDENGIIRSQISPGAEITIEDIKEDFAAFSQITAGNKAPCLTDMRGIKSINREAREYLSSLEAFRFISASALLIGSPVSKMIGNFFLGINKPPYPTKMFTSEAKAFEWLKEFIE